MEKGKHMQKGRGWLWTAGFFGFIAGVNAQTASPPAASTQFDGTYAFVSATNLTETYTDYSGRMISCPHIRTLGPLTIANGQAQYSTRNRYRPLHEGMVGSHGELSMQTITFPGKEGPPFQITTSGTIDGNGTIHGRLTGEHCQFDVVWQKQSQ